MSEQPPTIGRIVHYTLTEQDANNILAQRQNAAGPSSVPLGNYAAAGDTYPAMVVRVFGGGYGAANLQVFLDGADTYWATSRYEGEPDERGKWIWPPRV